MPLKPSALLFTFFAGIVSASAGTKLNPVPAELQDRIESQAVDLLSWQMGINAYTPDVGGAWQDLEEPGKLPSGTAALFSSVKAKPVEITSNSLSLAIDLGEYYLLDSLSFNAGGASGSLELAFADDLASPTSNAWSRPLQSKPFSEQGLTKITFSPVEARVVWLSFQFNETTSIESLSLFGDLTLGEIGLQLPPYENWPAVSDPSEWAVVDLGSRAAGARITHLNREGEGNPNALIDSDAETTYRVESDAEPFYFLVELADAYPIERAAMVMDAAAGHLALYAYSQLPDEFEVQAAEEGELYGVITLPDNFSEQFSPIARAHLAEPATYAELNTSGTIARYVLVEWRTNPHTLNVSSFSIFGNVPMPFHRFVPQTVLTAPEAGPTDPTTNPTPEVPDRLTPASE